MLKFQGLDLITPTERESRIVLSNKDDSLETISNLLIEKTDSRNLIMKLGSDGFIAYEKTASGFINRQHFPAMTINPLDVTGAGDSLISAMAVSLSSGSTLMEAAAIGAQIAAISDDIAYNNHDLDDGLRAGLFSVRDLNVLPEVGKIFSETFSELPDVEESIVVHESIRRLIGNMITDCLIETKRRLREFKPNSAKDVRDMGTPIVGFSGTM